MTIAVTVNTINADQFRTQTPKKSGKPIFGLVDGRPCPPLHPMSSLQEESRGVLEYFRLYGRGKFSRKTSCSRRVRFLRPKLQRGTPALAVGLPKDAELIGF